MLDPTRDQWESQMSNTLRGLTPLIAFVVLNAATDVYAGNMTQSVSPIAIAAVAFTLAALVFLGLDVTRRGAAAFRPRSGHRHDIIALNVCTALTWLTLLYSLKLLEPAVVSVVTFAIGPVITALLGPLLRRGSTVLATEVAVALGILVLIAVLSWGSLRGLSGVGEMTAGRAVLGLVLGVICGLGYSGTIIYSKRLDDAGLSPLSTLAFRYVLMIAVSWSLVGAGQASGVGSALLPGACIAIIGVGLTNYLGQVGIRYVEPITASLLDTLSPVCAFALQLFDGRLQPSGLTLGCIVGITGLVAIAVAARHRHETRRRPAVVISLEIITESQARSA
jgi:drug/metabolite transporter (DMT)-like permease